MVNEYPTWVNEYIEEYNQFKKKNKFRFILGLLFIIIGFTLAILYESTLDLLALIFIIFGSFLFAMYFSKELPYPLSNYLASMFYSLGINLEKNSDTESKIYLDKMDKYLKNCDNIIKNVDFSLRGGLYIKSIKEYTKKLNKLTRLLNQYYNNYSNYSIEKSEIAKKTIQLANLLHRDKEYLTDKHFDLINSMTNDLTNNNVEEKRLYASKTENIKNIFRKSISSIPYNVKLIVYIILVLIISYNSIIYWASNKGISNDTAFGFAITGSIAALVPALMIKDYILK